MVSVKVCRIEASSDSFIREFIDESMAYDQTDLVVRVKLTRPPLSLPKRAKLKMSWRR